MRKTSGWKQMGTLWLSLVVGALGGCDEQPIADAAVAAEVSEAPGEREGELCSVPTDCGVNEYCSTGAGACGQQGVCTTVPETCEPTADPVCGCDGTDYFNACSAAQALQSVSTPGTCGPPPCFNNSDCAADSYCATGVGACGREGVCTLVPEICDRTRDTVCGCDGRDFLNPCYAAQALQSVASLGACPPPPCYSNSDCAATSYCSKAIGDCGGAGTCKARPTLCSGLFKPVCGCNNATYGNACKAGSLGVSLFKNGAC